ncbi:MAG TPA: competence/damage-inducible protein A [Thermoleophilaceae bacterium]|nr:competence/damage-inducible protein A [Thermoleophilaceae bacterium]
MSARAGVVVTGTEVLTGRVRDTNGPWLADRLLELGVELAHITICGDRPEDMEAALRFQADQGCDVIATSGGLGPTADDLTMEVVARFCGRAMVHDPELEARIQDIVRPILRRYPRIDEEALQKGSAKQATVPEGADVLEPAGTAPGAVVTPVGADRPAIVVLPGPPRELQAMWPAAVATEAFKGATAGAVEYDQRMLRLFGMPESEIAETLRVAEPRLGGFDGLEITTCLRRGEVEVVVRSLPEERGRADALEEIIAERHPDLLFSRDGSLVDDQVAGLLTGRWIGLAESCTGGLLAARLTERAGSSAYVAGGVVSYSNESKADLLGVDPTLIEAHGAVSLEVAEAMADGALERFEADTAVSITGVAGPGGGTEAKPVGYVCWCVKTNDGRMLLRDTRLPGGRADVRDRATTVAMHLLRRLLRGEPSV